MAERLASRVAELPGGWTGAAWERGHRLRGALPVWSAAAGTPKRAQVLVLGAGIAGPALPAGRALSADAESRGGGGAGAAGGPGACPSRGGPLGLRGTLALPQPAGAPVVERPVGRRSAAAAGDARGTRPVPPLRRAGRPGASRGRFLDAHGASRLDARASGLGRTHLRLMAGRARPRRQTAALVSELLLPRRLWRGCVAGVRVGGAALLRQPARLHERRGARCGADLAARQRLAVGAPGRPAGRGLPWRAHGAARARGTARRVRAGLERARAGGRALGGRSGGAGDAAVHRGAAGGAAARAAHRGGGRHALRAVAGDQSAAGRAAAGAAGAPLSWDNVVYGGESLGYVNAAQQSLDPSRGPMVLTAYRALHESQRKDLLQEDWRVWAGRVLADMAPLHPDLPERLQRVELMRYGHAMSIPHPGLRGSAALTALRDHAQGRLHAAHADLAGYSVFEEAFTQGERVAQRLLNSARLPARQRGV
ncbi:hypothetical protein Ddc_23931 [Ditylenchus destructor]|nr:hypothetical protein Ddc_23931 [Ditylenchus destructor]